MKKINPILDEILIVDDETANLKLLKDLLSREGYEVRPADRPQLAINSALAKPPALILLDVRMPEMDGFEVCKRLKQDSRTGDIPIIFISALQDVKDKIRGFEAGGVDYITKPFQEAEILARVRTHIQLHRMQQNLEQLVEERTFELNESRFHLKQKVRELQESEKRLSLIYDSTADELFYIKVEPDDCFRFLSINSAFLTATGLTEDQIVGKRIEEVIPELSVQLVLDNYRKAIMANRIVRWEETSVYPSGEKIGHVSIAPVLNEKGICTHLVGSVHDITDRKLAEMELRGAYEEIEQLKNQLEAESAYLQEEIKSDHNFENIIGNSDALKYVLHRVSEVASTDAPVLILGETGTGKELIARAVHDASSRNKHALVKVNCANLPAALIENELFGHEKGAFTGADSRRIGRFQLADKATLFLDEISEIPIDLQAKLLRVLQDGEFEPVGSSKTVKTDVRIIAASNRSLDDEVSAGRFRSDLLYRINVFPITVPPLRHRKEDIPLLVKWFVDKFNRKMGKRISSIPAALIKHLQNYDWPGNIRELENVIERAVITSKNSVLKLTEKLTANSSKPGFKSNQTLAEVERNHILKTLEATGWKIEGNNGAAQMLGLAPSTIRSRMKKLGIKRPESN